MARSNRRTVPNDDASNNTTKPAITIEARENELVNLAMDAAEKRIREGTASSAEIVHFLKLGSRKNLLELDILDKQKELIVAKTDQIKDAKETDKLCREAIEAMKRYSGRGTSDEDIYPSN